MLNEELIKTQASKKVGARIKGAFSKREVTDAAVSVKSKFDHPVDECNYLFEEIMGEIEER